MANRDKARSDLYLSQLRSQSVPNTPGFGPLSPRDGGWRPPQGHPSYLDPHSAAENGAAPQSAFGSLDKELGNSGNNSNNDSDATVQYPRGFAAPKPITLKAPPIRIQGATPKLSQSAFSSPTTATAENPAFPASNAQFAAASPPSPTYLNSAAAAPMSPGLFVGGGEQVREHVPAAPGEQTYAAVPIPGAYQSPVASPSFAPAQLQLPSQAQQHHLSGFDFGDAVRSERR